MAAPFNFPAEGLSDSTTSIAYKLDDLLDQWDRYAENVYNARQSGKPVGIRTGIPKIDKVIGGTLQPGLHSLQGGPGVGKTALALQIATTCGFPALYVSCEMAPLELMRRITARVTRTFLNKIKQGELEPTASRTLVRMAISTCPGLTIVDATCRNIPVFENSSHINQANLFNLAANMSRNARHKLIVIDSIDSWSSKAHANITEYERFNDAISQLGALASALDCPVLCISERSKESRNASGISNGVGTKRLEHSSETVMEMDVENEIEKGKEKTIILKLSKNRNGVIGEQIYLRFNGALMSFREI